MAGLLNADRRSQRRRPQSKADQEQRDRMREGAEHVQGMQGRESREEGLDCGCPRRGLGVDSSSALAGACVLL